MKILSRVAIGAVFFGAFAGTLAAADGKLMHCFYFTPVASASDADWQAFYKATDALPSKIPGLLRVWYGKLVRPMPVFNVDAETRKKFSDTNNKVEGQATITRVIRQHGVCMEFKDEAALKSYAAHPEHKAWEDVYGKVRVPGTTTLDFVAPK
jgi:hypothetical protein